MRAWDRRVRRVPEPVQLRCLLLVRHSHDDSPAQPDRVYPDQMFYQRAMAMPEKDIMGIVHAGSTILFALIPVTLGFLGFVARRPGRPRRWRPRRASRQSWPTFRGRAVVPSPEWAFDRLTS